MKMLILFWFRMQAARAAKEVLAPQFGAHEVKKILHGYLTRYLSLKHKVPRMPTIGSSIMLHLASMSEGFYHELKARGVSVESTTKIFYEIALRVYKKMGWLAWKGAGIADRNGYGRLLKATKLFRAFPFNSPAYRWRDMPTDSNVVGFDCLKCPVAEYFHSRGLSDFCVETWCALDYPLANMWDAELKRTGSIAGGAKVCDFRWIVKMKEPDVRLLRSTVKL